MYLYSAMSDLALEKCDDSLKAAIERLWAHLTGRLMYVTGGIGAGQHNEGFTAAFELPNETAYCETCAAIGLVFWAHRLLQLDCDGRYADVMERALYNGILSGVSLDGERFFYVNPLASHGSHRRQEWFGVACCPPNLARLLASLGQYVYSQSATDIAVHLFIQGSGSFTIGGRSVMLKQETRYPWDGRVSFAIQAPAPTEFALKLRIPGWCREATAEINGTAVPLVVERGYASLSRIWGDSDVVELRLAMPVERVFADPRVEADLGRFAIQRGPIVFCLESADNPYPLNRLTVARDGALESRFEDELLGGVVTIDGIGFLEAAGDSTCGLYRSTPPELEPIRFKAIPYSVWENREPGEMLVWVREA
jgi:DUF1680 family protein